MIKKILIVLKEILITVVILFILLIVLSYIRKPDIGFHTLPSMKALTLIDDSEYSPKENKPLMLHFWMTSCPACKLEASNIQKVSERYEVVTIAVNSGSDADIQSYMQKNDLHFNVVNDQEGKWAQKFKISAYPTTFIFDSDGALKYTEVGYTTTAGLLARMKMAE